MKTLFFFQESISISIDAGKRAFDSIEPASSNFKFSDWIFGILALICVIYTVIALIKAYFLFYESPKKQSKWLKERFQEKKDKI
jgi:hypothetical protein